MEETRNATSLLTQVSLNRKWYLLVISLFGLITLFLAFNLRLGSSIQDHLAAKRALAKWEQSPSDLGELNRLLALWEKNPIFRKRTQAHVVQTLIQEKLFDQAAPYAEEPISQIRIEFPEYAFFAETTLLIERGLYQEALEKSIRLKDQMGKNESFLYAQNLLRIATLQKLLQNGPGEIFAWRECEEFFSSGSPFADEMLRCYREKKIDLKKYVQDQIARSA
ncbi:MAG: hypothetical protein IT584_00700 [Chlamydiae bacterium]|nr:hypothetical protein [Chlamydiota bacterium]